MKAAGGLRAAVGCLRQSRMFNRCMLFRLNGRASQLFQFVKRLNGMRKIFGNLIFIALTLVVLIVSGCGNRAKKDLNHLLMELAGGDHTIDHDDWMTLENYLDGQKANFPEFYVDGKLDADEVREYIEDFFSHRRDAMKIDFSGMAVEPLKVNFYLERSGSMIAYDSPAGDGSFKAAIVQMLNNLPGNNADHKIYVVNSSINAYPKGFDQFVKDSNIFEATKGIGDPSFTDFGAIFDKILNSTKDDELSILVTDMIYSTKDMTGVNPKKVFAEAQGMTNSVFKSEVKKKSMLIVKMTGSYNGLYYPYNSPSKGVPYNGKRPYYIVIVGNNENIARLTQDENYEAFAQLSRLRGYENMYLFETDDVYEPYYSLLLSHPQIRGRFQPERGQGTQVTKLEGLKTDRNSGDIRLVLAVDLSKMLIADEYLTDVNNYVVDADDAVTIKEIRPINKSDVTPAERKYAQSATHLFVLSVKEPKHEQKVRIKLLNRMPRWIASSSNDNDARVDGTTTFGLKYLLQGIYDSYRRNSDGKPYYFEMDLNFSK